MDEIGYCFDNQYSINIIDHNVKFFEITSNQYIKITKNGYEIVSLNESGLNESDSDSKESEELNFVVL